MNGRNSKKGSFHFGASVPQLLLLLLLLLLPPPHLLKLEFSSMSSAEATENSIMEIIDKERVEKLLAERRKNGSFEEEEEKDENRRKMAMENSIDGNSPFSNRHYNDYEYDSEEDTSEFGDFGGFEKPKTWQTFRDCPNRNPNSETKDRKIRFNSTRIPEVSSLLADFATGIRLGKILKSDKNSQLITRREYLKKDWCKTEPILQKIREHGCFTRTVLNRFCYGQCNSFYIPRNPPKGKKNRRKQKGGEGNGEGIEEDGDENYFFKSCGFCKPRKSNWIFVTLRCPSLIPPFRKKKIQRIKQCKCLSETIN